MPSAYPFPGKSNFAPEQPLVSLGHEKLNDLVEVVGATPPEGAMYALIQVEAGTVRFLDTPFEGEDTLTSSDGILLSTGTFLWFTGTLSQLRFLETEENSIVQIIYYKT